MMKSDATQNSSLMIDERLIWGVLILVLSLFSCGSTSSSDSFSGITGTLEKMPLLPETHEYVMWLDENNNTRLIASFVPGDDKIFRLASAPQSQFIADTDEIYVTIEEKNSGYTDPSIYEIVGARFTSNEESTVRTYPITSDVATVSGSIFLDYETNTDNVIIKTTDASDVSIINFPVLNTGWVYSFWHELDGVEKKIFISPDMESIEYFGPNLNEGVFKIAIESELIGTSSNLEMYILEYEVEGISGIFEMTPTLDNLPSGIITKER